MATRLPFWKWHINRLLSIHTSNVLLKFGLDIQSQTEVRVRKPKNPRWPPGGHFESDIAHGHQQHAYEISNWNSKANLSYAPETKSPTDGRTDRQTDGQGDSSIPTLLGGGIMTIGTYGLHFANVFTCIFLRETHICINCNSFVIIT